MVYSQSTEDQIFAAPIGGLYKIDAYGERGGNTGKQGVGRGAHGYNGTGYYNLGIPGNGGKVTGYVILKKGEVIILQVAKNPVDAEYIWTNKSDNGKYYAATACRGGRRVVVSVNGNTLLIAPGGGGAAAGYRIDSTYPFHGGAGGIVGGDSYNMGGGAGEIIYTDGVITSNAKGATQTARGKNLGEGKSWGNWYIQLVKAAEGYYPGGCAGTGRSDTYTDAHRYAGSGGGASAYIAPEATIVLGNQTYAASSVTGGNSQEYAWAEVTLVQEIKSNIKAGERDVKIVAGNKEIIAAMLGKLNIN